jgi:hypothetical protein
MRTSLTTTVATTLLLLSTAGCTADTDPPPSPDTPTSAAEPSKAAEPEPDYRIVPDDEGGTALEPGRWALAANGRADDTVLAELDVPAGWSGVSWFVGSDEVTVGYWLVTEVPTDPCHEEGRYDPGPTVDDLVRALEEQRFTAVTGKKPVTVGGHDGTYLEIVAPDIDYSACQQGQVWIWETPSNGARHHEGPAGAIERVWIVDVDGQRVVFNGLVESDDPAAVTELETAVASTSFVAP